MKRFEAILLTVCLFVSSVFGAVAEEVIISEENTDLLVEDGEVLLAEEEIDLGEEEVLTVVEEPEVIVDDSVSASDEELYISADVQLTDSVDEETAVTEGSEETTVSLESAFAPGYYIVNAGAAIYAGLLADEYGILEKEATVYAFEDADSAFNVFFCYEGTQMIGYVAKEDAAILADEAMYLQNMSENNITILYGDEEFHLDPVKFQRPSSEDASDYEVAETEPAIESVPAESAEVETPETEVAEDLTENTYEEAAAVETVAVEAVEEGSEEDFSENEEAAETTETTESTGNEETESESDEQPEDVPSENEATVEQSEDAVVLVSEAAEETVAVETEAADSNAEVANENELTEEKTDAANEQSGEAETAEAADDENAIAKEEEVLLNAEESSEEVLVDSVEIIEGEEAATAGDDFEISGTILERYLGNATSVIIPAGVTTIGTGAFKDNTAIMDVYLPEAVTAIERDAFRGCTNLRKVTVANQTGILISENAFRECVALTDINLYIANSIGTGAFENCTSLTTVYAKELKEIGNSAFAGCIALRYTDFFTSQLQVIGNNAFKGCTSLTELLLHECTSLTAVGDNAFENCTNVTQLTMPGSLTDIRSATFKGCTKLASVQFGANVQRIETSAFENCVSLKEVLLFPSVVTYIGSLAFNNCISLALVELPDSITNIESYAFNNCSDNVEFILEQKNASIKTLGFGNKGTMFAYTLVGGKATNEYNYAIANGLKIYSMNIYDYVKVAYKVLLERSSLSRTERYGWLKTIEKGTTAAKIVQFILTSSEFAGKGWSNTQIAQKLAEVMFGPSEISADEAEYIKRLNEFVSPIHVAYHLAEELKGSPRYNRFAAYCNAFPVDPGTFTLTEARDINHKITGFVYRAYKEILERDPDIPGLNAWCDGLRSGRFVGSSLCYYFLISPEFQSRGLTGDQTIEIMYKSFMNRSTDAAERAGWVSFYDQGATMAYLAYGFAISREFVLKCDEYGIKAGNVPLNNPADKNRGITFFVVRCYRDALEREPDVTGLNNWCNVLLTKKATPQNVAYNFVFSKESIERRFSNEEFIKMLYRLYMGREADVSGLNAWLGKLNSGAMSREIIAKYFGESPEFTNIVKSYGIK